MQTFDDTLMKTVDDILRNIFDEGTRKIIFQYLNESQHKEMSDRIQFFADSLPKIIGSGSVIIEDLILETLYEKFRLSPESRRTCGFKDSVMELRNRLEKQR